MISTNESLLFVPVFIMCDFVMFYCHCAVSLFKCYSVTGVSGPEVLFKTCVAMKFVDDDDDDDVNMCDCYV